MNPRDLARYHMSTKVNNSPGYGYYYDNQSNYGNSLSNALPNSIFFDEPSMAF
jgi:hypothetical protein